MECLDDGQIIRTKELDTNFTIPKKKTTDDSNDEEKTKPEAPIEQESILNNDYQFPAMGLYGPWPQPTPGTTPYLNYYQLYQQGCGTANTSNLNILKRIREEPKVYKNRDTCDDLSDATLPQELKELFQPLFCKLCSAQLGSTVNAKLHYKAKNHEKKVRKYLAEYSKRTGEPLHKRARINLSRFNKTEEDELNPRNFHCEICDLPLTGKLHADSHYMGKNHQKVLSGKKAPVGKGFYNEEGKFVRTLQVQSDGHDGFGLDFLLPKDPALPERATTLRCALCQVSVTSLPQMDMHLQGQKHQKKLRANGLAPVSTPEISPQALFASCRTPSGQYYCKACNISLNSESQFSIHLQSKNHKKKCSGAVKE